MRIKKFLDLYPKRNTVGVYRAGIYDFFDYLYGKVRSGSRVNQVEEERYEELADTYFNESRDHFEDLLTFCASMNGQAPIGARAKIAGVKEFLGYYNVEFTQRQLKQLSTKMPKGKTARTAERDVDIEALRKILLQMDLKGKALTLVLASSGARIGEILQVTLSDVDLKTTPAEIVIRGEYTKSGDTRRVFISGEAKEVLSEWLKIRESYLQSARNKNRGLIESGRAKEKSIIDDRVFPFTDRNVREIWENALTKASLWNKDNSTGWSQFRVHALRKFFRSQLALSCPVDIVEALMGHEGYLTEAYRRYSRKQMAEYYLKGEQHVTIMRGSGDLQEIQGRLEETQVTVKGYKGIIAEQAAEIAQLREDITTLRRMIEQVPLQPEKIPTYEAALKGRDGEIARIKEDILLLREVLEELVEESKRKRPPLKEISLEEKKRLIKRLRELEKEEEKS
jgi:integrase